MYNVKIQSFSGPLDLLLQLIEDKKMDITQLSLAEVTEEFINYMRGIINCNEGEVADFLAIAAKLIYIKSKALLPFLILAEEEEDAQQLEKQLKIYRQYLDATKIIEKIIEQKNFAYSRENEINKDIIVFAPPQNLTIQKLKEVFELFLKKIEIPVNFQLPKALIHRTVNIQEKMEHIKNLLFQKVASSFSDILKTSKDRMDIVVSFLAMLELVKQKMIIVSQDSHFQEIRIERIENN